MMKRAATLLALLLSCAALAGGSWYRGVIGDEPWQLELNIEGELVRGRLTHDALPLQLEGAGSFLEADGTLVAASASPGVNSRGRC